MAQEYVKTAERLKALAEPTRLQILEMLDREEMCVCEIIERLNMSQPAVSHHLKILRQAELITDRKEGKWVFYTLNAAGYRSLTDNLLKIKGNPVEKKSRPSICCDCEL
jgi:ArsR family transcriptional regulator